MIHLKTIKLKTLHHPEYYRTKQLELRPEIEDFNAQKFCLSKYFPKYYRNLGTEIRSKEWSFVRKLRQTKTVNHFTGCTQVFRTGADRHNKALDELEQKIFRNKRKSVKSLPLFFSPSEKWLVSKGSRQPGRPQFSPFFPKLTSLNLSLIEKLKWERMKSLFVNREVEQEIKRSYGYFWSSLRCLEHLEISSENSSFWFMIQEVNSSPCFLSSLKTFKLSLVFRSDPKSNSRVRNLLHQIAKNRKLLNHVTHLNCQEFEILHHFDEVMGSILAQCSKVISLNILVGREAWYWADAKEIFKEHEGTEIFKQIEKMSKLQALNVSAFGIKSFVKNFSVPLSVRKLVLYVGKSLVDKSWLDLFQEPEYHFFERWKGLSNLQTLELKVRYIMKTPNDLLHKFVNPLLEALQASCLKKFKLEVVEPAYYCVSDEAVLDFSLLRMKSSALKKLESFKILADGWRITLDPKYSHFLSALKKFAIVGIFPEEFDPKSFLKGFATAQYQKTLNFSTFSFKSIEAFDEFLKQAKKGAQSGSLVLYLKIELYIENIRVLFNHFKQPINLEDNLSVALHIWLMPPVPRGAEKKELSEDDQSAFKRIFGSFKLDVTQKGTSGRLNWKLL